MEDCRFIYEQADKAFADTIDTTQKILDRSTALLTIVSGLVAGLVAYSIDKWEKDHYRDAILTTAIIATIYYFLIGLFFIFPIIKPRKYILPGTQPRKLFVKSMFGGNAPAKGRILWLYLVEIKNLQKGIDINRNANDKRWELYKKTLSLLFYSPVFLCVIYFALDYLSK